MRVLWIGKAPQNTAAGVEVYDRLILAALRQSGLEIDAISPCRVSRAQELANLARGIPHHRARYLSSANRKLLAEAVRGHRWAISSWEPFDMLAHGLPCLVLPILHNITSLALPSMFPANILAKGLAATAARWEHTAYSGGHFPAIAVLSRSDAAYVHAIAPRANLVYAPPGLPVMTPLSPAARFSAEVLIAGTFDWRVKRRDVLRLTEEWHTGGQGLCVFSDPLPAQAAHRLKPAPLSQLDLGAAIRIGVIPDRFEAGHKLKAGAYIAGNAVVVSFADISSEYHGIEDAGTFVRHIRTASEITAIANELAAIEPALLRRRWLRFQSQVQQRFSWQNSAAVIAAALGHGRPHSTRLQTGTFAR